MDRLDTGWVGHSLDVCERDGDGWEQPLHRRRIEWHLSQYHARRHGRVMSGGSQRVWDDYNSQHRLIRGGAIGEVQEVWIDCGGPSGEMVRPVTW